MNPKLLLLILTLFILAAPLLSRGEEPAPTAETRLRQALRDTMIQLRDAQNQAVTLQAAQAQNDKDKADLQAKVDELNLRIKGATDQAIADKDAADKAISDLKAQVADQTGQIARLTEALKQWKDAYNQASQLAVEKEAARNQYAIQAAILKRTADDREVKNLALYKLGSEILKRYEQFGLGDAITAKEPFVGVSRVKLENLVQDYKNKLLDQAIISGKSVPPASDRLEGQLPVSPPAPEPEKSGDTVTTTTANR